VWRIQNDIPGNRHIALCLLATMKHGDLYVYSLLM
jgi:hypothetical protein